MIATFLAFGSVFMTAQTTKKVETKSATKTTMLKSAKSTQKSNAPKMVDTANIEQRQKEADEKVAQPAMPRRDGLTDEAIKPQAQPAPGQLE
ncbi:hypothetical protein [Epilithonimonas sp.]|uniref:hypothetical protein n=1 Tax=Epilithonimonas sp. TaxID=2894511 RepID=UPI002899FFF3|nr:hypothetical protein [Epilithonimonas sp.]